MRIILIVFVVVVALVLTALAGIFLYGRDNFWMLIAGPPSQRPIEFSTLELKATDNQYLVCPEDLCERAEPHRLADVYAVPAESLRRSLLEVIDDDPGSSLRMSGHAQSGHASNLTSPRIVVDSTSGNTLRVVARTALMRFPDIISVDIIEVSQNRSTLALYGRSQIGRSDLGVNKARIDRWLTGLAARLPIARRAPQ